MDGVLRDAAARGAFDDLPGAGKPLPPAPPGRHDENWWIKQFAERENVPGSEFLPEALRIRKEVETLDERMASRISEDAVRRELTDLDRRIRTEILLPTSAFLCGPPLDIEAVLARWREARAIRPPVTRTEPAPPAPRRGGWRRWLFGPGG
ncbi:DUF1992 domain-containing protein [Nakamurella flavida]|uniref:DUF1992 domain-containing protein n=1 Tax=Nakamurella flavida TaxID=363630 RepID=A0A938YN83_9ACTN|nr:DUF1992 domain-containing protein [Nakamurella flavida]MBM9475975.1 DUF1992 domain-containing protein [Nakamurella flavida]MBM9478365.1 DUF1992 domain-containing protein [Nakamurella flavida]MDP9777736.1 hypothetical protein [Nakamurella flavida]